MGYRDIVALSGSELGLLADSPAKLKHRRENPPEATDAMILGSLVHALVLKQPLTEYRVMPEGMQRRGKEYDSLLASTPSSQLLIPYKQWQEAQAIARDVAVPWNQGIAEQELVWLDGGVLCKGKTDYYEPVSNTLWDLKTTSDAHPDRFKWTMKDRSYALQLAHYAIGIMNHYKLSTPPVCKVLAVETKEPYCYATYTLSASSLEQAIEHRKELLTVYAECVSANVWSRDYGEYEV